MNIVQITLVNKFSKVDCSANKKHDFLHTFISCSIQDWQLKLIGYSLQDTKGLFMQVDVYLVGIVHH